MADGPTGMQERSAMRLILPVIRFFDRQSKLLIVLLAFASLVPLGLLGAQAGYAAIVGFLYLAPLSFITWHTGRRWGIFFSVVCAAIWASTNAAARVTPGSPWMPYLTAAAALTVFLAVTFLLSSLRAAHDQETTLARTDALTGVANSRWFRDQLDREIRRCRRYRHPFTVIYGDLDNFKDINDRLGHAVGDALLQEVAVSMQRTVRSTDLVARLGGDEFAVLLPETGRAAGNLVAQQLRQGVLEAMHRRGWSIRASFGVVTCVEPPGSVHALLDRADALMYAAKREGEGGVRHETFAQAPHSSSP